MALKAGRVGVNPAQVDELGNIPMPEAYELPKATADKLGGIKVGSGLSVTSGGVLSAVDQLPAIGESDAGKVVAVNAAHTGYELVSGSSGGWRTVYEDNTGAQQVDINEDLPYDGLYRILLPIKRAGEGSLVDTWIETGFGTSQHKAYDAAIVGNLLGSIFISGAEIAMSKPETGVTRFKYNNYVTLEGAYTTSSDTAVTWTRKERFTTAASLLIKKIQVYE